MKTTGYTINVYKLYWATQASLIEQEGQYIPMVPPKTLIQFLLKFYLFCLCGYQLLYF